MSTVGSGSSSLGRCGVTIGHTTASGANPAFRCRTLLSNGSSPMLMPAAPDGGVAAPEHGIGDRDDPRRIPRKTRASIEVLRKYVRNLEDENIAGSFVASPLDIAGRNINNADGSCHGGAHLASQSGWMRPVPGWASHRMPINGLYLTGAGTHPGGSVTGLPGRNSAWVILDDLGTSTPAVLEAAAGGKTVLG